MDTAKENEYVFNFKLARLTGLYQILDPTTITLCGYNVCRILMVVFSLYLCFMSSLGPISLYYLTNDVIAFTFYAGSLINYLCSCFKMNIFINRSKDIWNLIDVAGFGYMSYQHYNRNIFTHWRTICVRTSYAYVTLVSFILLCWAASPLVFSNATVKIKNIDGSHSKYHINVINSFVMLSDDTCNEHLVFFYSAELTAGVLFMYFTTVFDILVIMMCFALCCQLEAISSAAQSLGYGHPFDDNYRSNVKDISNLKNTCDTFHNLKTIITDHQSVMRKLIDFHDVIWSVILVQMIVASCSTVFIWFITAVSFSETKISESVLSIKLFTILPLFTFQLLMTCYLFGIINEKKNSFIPALYNSNWIDMDLKSQKMILCAMNVNNTNDVKLKFTSANIVNLEMFSHTMRLCYTMCSVLTKYKNKN